MKKYCIRKSILYLFATGLLGACSSGTTSSSMPSGTYSVESYIGMPITSSVCYSAQFFSPQNLTINTTFGDASSCVPYIQQKSASDTLESATVSQVVAYYYGISATLATSCPAITSGSEQSFPESSGYVQEMKATEYAAMTCAQNALNAMPVINNPMFVFDIDDTLTASYISGCQNAFGAFQVSTWNDAMDKNAFIRTPEMDKLLRYAFEHNIAVAFVTGREVAQYQETLQNLLVAYPEFTTEIQSIVAQGHLIMLPLDEESWTVDSYKNAARQNLAQKGYTVVLNMGDQYSDLDYIYPYSNQPACSYKLPNYMYYIK